MMNSINQVSIKYLRPSRTIEKLELSLGGSRRMCFVYNYGGNFFRLFEDEAELNSFFKYGKEPDTSFENEQELDHFLQTFPL